MAENMAHPYRLRLFAGANPLLPVASAPAF
jgi:hypothetical protein